MNPLKFIIVVSIALSLFLNSNMDYADFKDFKIKVDFGDGPQDYDQLYQSLNL